MEKKNQRPNEFKKAFSSQLHPSQLANTRLQARPQTIAGPRPVQKIARGSFTYPKQDVTPVMPLVDLTPKQISQQIWAYIDGPAGQPRINITNDQYVHTRDDLDAFVISKGAQPELDYGTIEGVIEGIRVNGQEIGTNDALRIPSGSKIKLNGEELIFYNLIYEEQLQAEIADLSLKLGSVLGAGSFGTVRDADFQGMKVAIKFMPILNEDTLAAARKEIMALIELKDDERPFVVQIHGIKVTSAAVLIIQEYIPDGTLHDLFDERVERGEYFTNEELLKITSQGAIALDYLKSINIIYRDLKPENMLLRDAEKIEIAFADFGLAKLYDQTAKFATICGTTTFAAPEINSGRYNHSCDLWSLGAVIYFLVTGCGPYPDSDDFEKPAGEVIFQAEQWLGRPRAMQECITGMLLRDPTARWSIEMVLGCDWFNEA